MSKFDNVVQTYIDTTTVQRQLSLKLRDIERPDCMQDIAELTADFVQEFVPYDTGALRESIEIRGEWKYSYIAWHAPYANYQYKGEVWGPNKPVFTNGVHTGWERGKGKRKNTGRMMGTNTGTYVMKYGPNKGKTFEIKGYTTPNTTHHWDIMARKSRGYRVWRKQITDMMKERWENSRKEYYR